MTNYDYLYTFKFSYWLITNHYASSMEDAKALKKDYRDSYLFEFEEYCEERNLTPVIDV